MAAEPIFSHPEYRPLVEGGLAKLHHFRWAVGYQSFLARTQGAHFTARTLLERFRYLNSTPDDVRERRRDADAMRITRALPPSLLVQYRFVPQRLEDGTLIVSPLMPLSEGACRDLITACHSFGFLVDKIVEEPAPLPWIRGKLDEINDDKTIPFDMAVAEVERDPEDAEAETVERALFALLGDALRKRASDIRIDFSASETTISYRVDGHRSTRWHLRFEVGQAIVGLIKQRSRIHDAERDTPQGGRIQHIHQGRDIDIRVACGPTLSGELITLRLLDPAQWGSLDEILICAPALLNRVQSALRRNVKTGGALLLTGPTGHGKSTTLASGLTEIDREKHTVLTVEKPAELRIPGVQQFEVAPLPGRSFAELLSHLVRQDPDVIALSEINDAETVAEWMHSLDSGHLAPATLHGDSIFDAVDRVMSYLDPTSARRAAKLICEKLIALVNQRLFRRVCVCSTASEPTPDEINLLPEGVTELRRARPGGCPLCEGVGYRDRICIPEYLIMPTMREDPVRRDAILRAIVDDGWASVVMSAAESWYHPRSEAAAAALRLGFIDLPTYLEAEAL